MQCGKLRNLTSFWESEARGPTTLIYHMLLDEMNPESALEECMVDGSKDGTPSTPARKL
jgi:hypothetical protein